MLELIKTEFERLKCKPFPPHGKSIGEFPLYDTLLMGIVSSYLGGEKVSAESIPFADTETVQEVERLRKKSKINIEQKQFLDYFNCLESLRKSLHSALATRKSEHVHAVGTQRHVG